ncbi:MAG: hypothetical protein ACRD3S_12125 [Terracidiphilus sp.]
MANTIKDQTPVDQTKRYADRLLFSQLIAENRNHFGNFAEIKFAPVDSHTNDTTFEELTHVGYNPDLGVLEAVIQIKQPYGYLGDHRTPGSYEYIRFYVDSGNGFEHAGLVSVNAHDLPHGTESARQTTMPLSYAASVPYTPPNCEDCDNPSLPRVRAILSWQAIPSDPKFPVSWGNALDCRISLKPGPTTVLDAIVNLFDDDALASETIESQSAASSQVPSSAQAPLTLAQRAELYGGKVPAHRFAYKDVHDALLDPAVDGKWVAGKMAEFSALNIDWANAAGALTEQDADATFEQLDSVALEARSGCEQLVATFRIKQNAGYSGNLATAGSYEYVAFWADWDNMSSFAYLGTVPVKVHDVNRASGEDVCYTAALPVNLSVYRTGRETAKIARIRAVLSWAVPPSTTNPNATNSWGNSIDALVRFPVGRTGSLGGNMPRSSSLTEMFPGAAVSVAQTPAERTTRKIESVPSPAPASRPNALMASAC